jgi:hypothetical protein
MPYVTILRQERKKMRIRKHRPIALLKRNEKNRCPVLRCPSRDPVYRPAKAFPESLAKDSRRMAERETGEQGAGRSGIRYFLRYTRSPACQGFRLGGGKYGLTKDHS